ncbi:MAG: hypothetical protein M3461_16490, partial [Pseudomonadota bacterium]|nr:hypothetical protein [Pseudomonadota bacterium]
MDIWVQDSSLRRVMEEVAYRTGLHVVLSDPLSSIGQSGSGPGSGPTVVSIEGVPTALSICEDIWVDGTAAQARAAGARLIVN